MAKNANVSDGTLPIDIGKEKTIVERYQLPGSLKDLKVLETSRKLKQTSDSYPTALLFAQEVYF